MRTILLAVCLMWCWHFFHEQMKAQAHVYFVTAMAWFGVDTRPYFAAARSNGTGGVLDTFTAQVQSDTRRYMVNGNYAGSGG